MSSACRKSFACGTKSYLYEILVLIYAVKRNDLLFALTHTWAIAHLLFPKLKKFV